MKAENTPAPGDKTLSTRFGGLSRGKCWGKYTAPGASGFEWLDKRGGTLILRGPGKYVVGSDDGFARKARAEFVIKTPAPTNDARPSNLHPVHNIYGWHVSDDEGGVWWPSDEAQSEIAQAADPERAAVEMCQTAPMRGVWHA